MAWPTMVFPRTWKWVIAACAFAVIVITALAVGFGKRRVHNPSSPASGAASHNGAEPSIPVPVPAPSPSPSRTPANPSGVVSSPASAAPASTSSSQVPNEVKEPSPSVYAFEVVKTYPHDLTAFTEGLVYAGNDTFYESTGLYGHSSIRLAELHTGKVRQQRNMDRWWFGEGLTIFGGKLRQLVYKSNQGFEYDPITFDVIGNFTTPMTDGWGLTHNGSNLIGSDGTAFVYFFDPEDFRETKRVRVTTDDGFDVTQINELEYINGEIWANIWQTDCIARISPETGQVLGWMYLSDLKMSALSNAERADRDKVLNGIAYDAEGDRIFVTGKEWPSLFEIKVRTLTNDEMSGMHSLDFVQKMCTFR